jgi:hypothetical protein
MRIHPAIASLVQLCCLFGQKIRFCERPKSKKGLSESTDSMTLWFFGG